MKTLVWILGLILLSSAATLSSFALFLAMRKMLNPYLASRLHIASPIPSDDPVTTAQVPSASNLFRRSKGYVRKCFLIKREEWMVQAMSLSAPTTKMTRVRMGPSVDDRLSKASV